MTELNVETVERLIREKGQQGAADELGKPRSTIRDFAYRHNLPTTKDKPVRNGAELKVKKDSVDVSSKTSTEGFTKEEEIIKEHGLDPDKWEFQSLSDSQWDSPNGETLHSRKLNLRSKEAPTIVLPARPPGKTFEKPTPVPEGSKKRAFLVGDHQAPFVDEELHESQLEMSLDYDPDEIVFIGDTGDFPDISRYKKQPEIDLNAKVQDCVDGSYRILRDYREAHPKAKITKIIGNHDVRLRDFIIANVPQIYGLTVAEGDNPILSLNHLLRLDELAIDLVGDNQSYEHGQYNISPHLAARHGWIASKGSGATALKTLEHLGFSIVVGHTHRQSLVHKTTFDIDGERSTISACEIGCSCIVDITGGGFAPGPDWQQGCATADVWEDGKFKIDLATYVNGNLFYRDNRY